MITLISNADLVKKAVEHFGLTTDVKEAGYILADGRMLDFSGKREGGEPGDRVQDHREIQYIFEGPVDAMDEFMRQTGAIRFGLPDGGGMFLDFRGRPTPAQIRVIQRAFKDHDVDYVEIDSPGGHAEVDPATWPLTVEKLRGLSLVALDASRTIVWDFDGTITPDGGYSEEIPPPRPEIVALMHKAKAAGLKNVIASCRWSVHELSTPAQAEANMVAAQAYMAEWGIPYDELRQKPLGEVYVDDKACHANDLVGIESAISRAKLALVMDENPQFVDLYEAMGFKSARNFKPNQFMKFWIDPSGQYYEFSGDDEHEERIREIMEDRGGELIGQELLDYALALGWTRGGSGNKKLYFEVGAGKTAEWVLGIIPSELLFSTELQVENFKDEDIDTIPVLEGEDALDAWKHRKDVRHRVAASSKGVKFWISPQGGIHQMSLAEEHDIVLPEVDDQFNYGADEEFKTGTEALEAAIQSGWVRGGVENGSMYLQLEGPEESVLKALESIPQEMLFVKDLTVQFGAPAAKFVNVDVLEGEDAKDAWQHRNDVRHRVKASDDEFEGINSRKFWITPEGEVYLFSGADEHSDNLDLPGMNGRGFKELVHDGWTRGGFSNTETLYLQTEKPVEWVLKLLPYELLLANYLSVDSGTTTGVAIDRGEDALEAWRHRNDIRHRVAASDGKFDYSCLMIDYPPELVDKVIEWGTQNIPDDVVYDPEESKRSFGRENHIHTTVAYGIDPEVESGQIKVVVGELGHPVRVRLGKVSKFDTDPNYDVIKIEVEGQDLHDLHKAIEDQIGVPGNTFPEYKPHLTIAYVLKGSCDELLGQTPFEGQEFELDAFDFSDPGASHEKFQMFGSLATDTQKEMIREAVGESIGEALAIAMVENPRWIFPSTEADGIVERTVDRLAKIVAGLIVNGEALNVTGYHGTRIGDELFDEVGLPGQEYYIATHEEDATWYALEWKVKGTAAVFKGKLSLKNYILVDHLNDEVFFDGKGMDLDDWMAENLGLTGGVLENQEAFTNFASENGYDGVFFSPGFSATSAGDDIAVFDPKSFAEDQVKLMNPETGEWTEYMSFADAQELLKTGFNQDVAASLSFNSYVRKRGDKWVVVSKTGKTLGTHDSKESADRQLRAIEVNKHMHGSLLAENQFDRLYKEANAVAQNDAKYSGAVENPAIAQEMGDFQQAVKDARSEEDLQVAWQRFQPSTTWETLITITGQENVEAIV